MDVSPSGSGTVEVNETTPSSYPFTTTFSNGTSVELRVVPTPGYGFDNWSGDLSGTTNPAAIVIDCNKKVTANFFRITPTLSVHVNGSGSTTLGVESFEEGTAVSITANPDTGWQFDGWAGDVADPNSATTVVIMNSAKIIVANFSQIMHTLGIRVNGSGSTTPLVGNHSYGEGTKVSVAAIPDGGWQFDGWAGDIADPNPATSVVIMNSTKTITANFSKAMPHWWIIGGAIAGIAIIGAIIWFVIRGRMS